MDEAKQQLVDKLKSSNNVLVTVSRDPSVDQLAACLGLSLLLNKLGKHTAAVFSGQVPSTLEFLQPEETLEKNTDSLRDFIIALDKSKADKLRYKVEDNVVRIFITPYKTSISEADLEFSQGDFNVDLVVALGVGRQEDLDEAITVHGRILHDATVASINISGEGGLGSINWNDPQASSLSELVTELAQQVGSDQLDSQIATALLTGIVSETDRFSNDKTSSHTMSISAALMAAGANQQLVASKLEEPGLSDAGEPAEKASVQDEAGTMEIDHNDEPPAAQPFELPPPADDGLPNDSANVLPPAGPAQIEPAIPPEPPQPPSPSPEPSGPATMSPGSKIMTGPPILGGTLTANTHEEGLDPVTDPLSLPTSEPPQLLERKDTAVPGLTPQPPSADPLQAAAQALPDVPSPDPLSLPSEPPAPAPMDEPSLSELEAEVKQKEKGQDTNLDQMRDEVSRALSTDDNPKPEPIEALNAQPLGGDLHPDATAEPPQTEAPSLEEQIPGLKSMDSSAQNATPADNPSAQVSDPNAPPPVPPPIPFQFGSSQQ